MKVKVAVLGSLPLIILMVPVDVKQHSTWNSDTQELCESRGGRPGFPAPNKPYGLCGRKATLTGCRVRALAFKSQKLSMTEHGLTDG